MSEEDDDFEGYYTDIDVSVFEDHLDPADDSGSESDEEADQTEATTESPKIHFATIQKELSEFKCCKEECCAKFTAHEILSCRQSIHTKRTQVDRRHALRTLVDGGIRVLSTPVCVVFFCFAYGTSKYSVYRAKSKTSIQRMPTERSGPKADAVVAFLDSQSQFGEMQPDSMQIHLSHPNKKMVYQIFKESHANLQVSYVYFLGVWRSQRPHIKLRKHLRYVGL